MNYSLLYLMNDFNKFIDLQWVSTYVSSDQLWLNDSLNREKVLDVVTADWSFISFIFQSSFINQHLEISQLVNLTTLDLLLLQPTLYKSQTLYHSFLNDLLTYISNYNLMLFYSFQSEYQDIFSDILFIAPELILGFNDFLNSYFLQKTINVSPVAVFDSFNNNLNFYSSESVIYFLLFVFYAWFINYILLKNSLLTWSNNLSAQFTRFYYYFFSVSREIRIQLEVVFQTILFFMLYWLFTLMVFDDDQEEIIEFVDTSFFYFFSIIILYLFYKHSIHYFAFLEASVSEGRSVAFVSKQFFNDFLGTLSLLLRFYILLFRMNVYDSIEDVLDSYYIFVGDFDDDEYLSELFLTIHGTLFFTLDNNDDRSFLLEDENDFSNDLFYLYFTIWGKLFFFIVFTIEEAGRLSLAFYISYLITFEVHAVGSSYKEDQYLNNKRLNN